jgi:cytosine deaminase
MDLFLRHARLCHSPDLVNIVVRDGRVAGIGPDLETEGPALDLRGRLLAPGFVETHLHLDKACILDRCARERGDLEEAISEVSKAKEGFTPEDVYKRAKATLERCILQGATHVRTHLEVDPGIGLRGLEGVLPLVREYAWAVDLEICVFPQEGMLNNPGTEELMLQALDRGCKVLGGCPYTDSDPHAQIDRLLEIARERDVDLDMHLDFSLDARALDLDHLCRQTEKAGWGGRVTAGHVSKLSALEPPAFAEAARRLKSSGVAITVLPATDLYLMGRPAEHNVPRGVTPVHRLLEHGVCCSLATNNVLNPFTPFGDGSLLRMANLYANVAQVGTPSGAADCFSMITDRAARLLNLQGYGIQEGSAADFVLLDCADPSQAVAEIAPVLAVWKNGRRTVTRQLAQLHQGHADSGAGGLRVDPLTLSLGRSSYKLPRRSS